MSVATVLRFCIGLYSLAILVELVLHRKITRFFLEAALLVLVVAIALLVNNAMTGKVSFGPGTSPIATVAVMFVSTILGIAARYIFYLQKGYFSLLAFVKPLVITPIVLLPLIGSVQTSTGLSPMQVLSFAVLAFQNGFFWQAVLAAAKPATETSRGI